MPKRPNRNSKETTPLKGRVSIDGSRWKRRLVRGIALISSLVLLLIFFLRSHQEPKTAAQLVPDSIPGYPSFRSYAGNPYEVTYDGRSILLDGKRGLFIGGSMHPVRATRATWDSALDLAVTQGLNLITIYVMWAEHQKFPDAPYDWSLPGGDWTLADSIEAAAKRGLFVHLRVGPYVCAEYSYGGIPEWVAMDEVNMAMRRPNLPWMDAMTTYLRNVISYIQENQLFAYQGGPIILAQIENELGEDDLTEEHKQLWAFVDEQGRFVDRNEEGSANRLPVATLQDYADWCGQIAEELAPDVVWTMCNGLSAEATIDTYNGFLESMDWLESRGDSGRIQVDQPALWTEDEGGFQIWGDIPEKPSEYVWGVKASAMAFTALQWFARGGSHLNFYMWWGGYNRGRSAAGGIANMYALEAHLCPSGEPREPKFSHLRRLIDALVDVAPALLESNSAIDHSEKPEVLQKDGSWMKIDEVTAFRYHFSNQEVIFLENTSRIGLTIRTDTSLNQTSTFLVDALSAIFAVNGQVVYNSAHIAPNDTQHERLIKVLPFALLEPKSWTETLCLSDIGGISSQYPIEQTKLNMKAGEWTDYARYQVRFALEQDRDEDIVLQIESVQANALTVHVDGVHIGSIDTHKHTEGSVIYSLPILTRLLKAGQHNIVILSESLGYANVVGRWGSGTSAKLKGLTGSVTLTNRANVTMVNLTSGEWEWTSLPGLSFDPPKSHHRLDHPCGKNVSASSVQLGRWTEFKFRTPHYDDKLDKLYMHVHQGRGHAWLNGHDLGRYWNITEGNSKSLLSQSYYHLPHDLLDSYWGHNRLVLFDSLNFGSIEPVVRLVSSHVGPSSDKGLFVFPDEVGFELACLRR